VPVIEKVEGPIFTPDTVFLPTYAVMLYPRDETRRRQWYAAAMAREYSVCQKEGAPQKVLSDFHAWIPDLWELKLSPARVYQDGMARTGRATLSGCVLLCLLRLAKHHLRHSKLERVKALLASEVGGFNVSESLIEKSWAEFQTVSHLWASILVKPPKAVMDWLSFLKRALTYRRATEEAELLSVEMWKTEMDHLFRLTDQDEPELEPLEPDKIAYLDDQFPHLKSIQRYP